MKRSVIIVAGGKGLRMGGDLPKQFIPVQGKPLLMHTMGVFYRWDATVDLLTVIPEEHASYWNMLCRELNFSIAHRVVYGGETRFHSVRNGLHEVEGDGLIAIHDGVRPYVTPDVITSCFKAAEMYGAAIPVVPMVESVREIMADESAKGRRGEGAKGRKGEGKKGRKEEGAKGQMYDSCESRTFDRSRLCIVQTPQVFRSDILRIAYEQPYSEMFTDDASVVEAAGYPIRLVEGNRENIKITTPTDLEKLPLCTSVSPLCNSV